MKFLTIWKRKEKFDEVVHSVPTTDAYQVEITKHFACVRFNHGVASLHTLAKDEFVTLESEKKPRYYKSY